MRRGIITPLSLGFPPKQRRINLIGSRGGDMSETIRYKVGDDSGSLSVLRFDYSGKNKVLIALCKCGKERSFWKQSAFGRQKSCGCGIDCNGITAKQRRSWNLRLQGYKNGAKKRNYCWELSTLDFIKIASQDCYFCGEPAKEWECFSNAPSIRKDSPNSDKDLYVIKITGIDRLNNKIGYTLENCVPCCVYCNRAKSDLSLDDFIARTERLHAWLLQNLKKQK